ncbi:MAG: glycosyltransferase family 1 protein, partial [Candidatus Methanomethylicaceae archaeon]
RKKELNMPRILLEALGINRAGGARTATLNTIQALPCITPNVQFVVCVSQFESVLAGIPQIKQVVIPGKNRFMLRIKLWWLLPLLARRLHIDLVHFMKNLMVGFLHCPRVVTIHDLTTLKFPQTQSCIDVTYWRWIEPVHLRQADRIIAVSQETADDLITLYHISPQRVRVVRWAPHDCFLYPMERERIKSVQIKYGLPDNYVLFVGILAKKKNLKTLLRAIYALHKTGQDIHLVIAGRPYPQSDASNELNLISALGLDHLVHYIGEVPDEDLPALYAGARVYVMPSIHEGFGIPCWEAMAVGTPVIASNRGALSEVVGGAGILINDPLNVAEWAEAIQRCLEDEQLRTRLIESGYQRVRGRTWRTVAAETFAVYQEVCPALKDIQVKCPPELNMGSASSDLSE